MACPRSAILRAAGRCVSQSLGILFKTLAHIKECLQRKSVLDDEGEGKFMSSWT